jgi:hypothetical protein
MPRPQLEEAMSETDGMGSSAYWRDRAEEVRRKAGAMRDGDAEKSMLEIARMYDRMADRAALREAKPTE